MGLRALAVVAVAAILAPAAVTPTFDWYRPPSEPILIKRVNHARLLRLAVAVRVPDADLDPDRPLYLHLQPKLAEVAPRDAVVVEVPPFLVLYSHRARLNGSALLRYEYSNFIELPSSDLAYHHDTGVSERDVMLYLGFGGAPHRERVVSLDLQVLVDHTPGQHYGACEKLRRPATVAQLIEASARAGTNRDVVVRSTYTTGFVNTRPISSGTMLTFLIDIPAYDRDSHTPVLALRAPKLHELIKVLAVGYFADSIWEGKLVEPLTHTPLTPRDTEDLILQYDLTAMTHALHARRNMLSGNSVMLAIFLLTNNDATNITLAFDLDLHGLPPAQRAVAPAESIASLNQPSVDLVSTFLSLTALICAVLAVQGISQTINALADQRAGYEVLTDCRDVHATRSRDHHF